MSLICDVSTYGSVLLVGSIALIGLATMRWDDEKLRKCLPVAIAIAAGVLLGEAGFHLIPESLSQGLPRGIDFGLVVAGALGSWAIELGVKALSKSGGVAPVARIAILAESVHNGLDGAIIAAAYLAGFKVGVLATLAVAIHELPHELGNFAVLVDSGYTRTRAIWLNLVSACAAFLGATALLILGKSILHDSLYVLPVAAGCFIYMSAVDLVPSLLRRAQGVRVTLIGFGVTAGAALMLALTFAR